MRRALPAPRPWWLLVAICAVAALLRFWRLGEVALLGDESYYWLWSERLAPAYFDNPAGVAFLVRLSTLLGGGSEAGIRWLNAGLGLCAVALAYAVGARLFSPRAAALSSALLALGAPYLVISRFVYTDALQVALLLLSTYLLIPFVDREPGPEPIASWRFWAVGLSVAALFNTKYNAYLYALSVAALLLWRRSDLLRQPHTWLAVATAACGLLPTLLWNATHGWVSFRWQIQHFAAGAFDRPSALGSLGHAVRYLTAPLSLLAALALTQVRSSKHQLLLLPAVVLTLPMLLSPIDSPRNLIAGLSLALIVSADVVLRWLRQRAHWLTPTVLSAIVLAVALYGLGTIAATLGPTCLPHSSAASLIRQESSGWRDAPSLALGPAEWVFAVDYQIAAQLRYYTGIPVRTAWGQYRLWDRPESVEWADLGVDQVTLLALTYVDPQRVSSRLQRAFEEMQGPEQVLLSDGDAGKVLYVWRARGPRTSVEEFYDLFDLMHLAQAGARDG
jgi:4-amino-4-deoxy-L-arabinose transferase-like glycosyltransferase